MKVLLDECVDSRLAAHLGLFEVVMVAFQQHLPKFSIAVILLAAHSNRLADLIALAPELIQVMPIAKRGVVTKVGL